MLRSDADRKMLVDARRDRKMLVDARRAHRCPCDMSFAVTARPSASMSMLVERIAALVTYSMSMLVGRIAALGTNSSPSKQFDLVDARRAHRCPCDKLRFPGEEIEWIASMLVHCCPCDEFKSVGAIRRTKSQ